MTAPTPVDANGVSGEISYQWQSRNVGEDLSAAVNIDGATEATLVVTDADLGKVLSVNVSYTMMRTMKKTCRKVQMTKYLRFMCKVKCRSLQR